MTTRSSTLPWSAAVATLLTLAVTMPAIAETQKITITNNGSTLGVTPANITGTSGGNVNSNFCGWIASSPNHVLQIKASSIVSLKLSVIEPNGGASKPFTLLIKDADNPNADPFCAIADPTGIPAEIGGVWNPGNYKIFVGDFEQGSNPYVLKISQ